jgi:hypothetical protein
MGLETGREDDHVHGILETTLGLYAAPGHHGDRVGEELDVGPGQRRVPGVGRHYALTAHLIHGGHLAAQLGVLDRLGDLVAREPPEGRPKPGLARQGQRAEFVEAERGGPVEPLQRRDTGKHALGERRSEVKPRNRQAGSVVALNRSTIG